MTPPFATRFAPSPTGWLHRGHALSALTGAALARRAGGRFLVRIEDIDAQRSRPRFEAAIFEDLAWLGLEWETPVRRQSQHLAQYEAALRRLIETGLLYRCFRSRSELAAITSAPHEIGPARTPGRHRPDEEAERLAAGEPFAWRLDIAAAVTRLAAAPLSFEETGAGPDGQRGRVVVDPYRLGDAIVARKDLGVSYHLAVVVDDALQAVSVVTRGADLFEATHFQRLLQALLGLPEPIYHHHPLILAPDRRRLAKRDEGETLRALRAAGVTAAEVRASVGF
ncbi:MAG TPA: tRNA glutamyl-Q(34) synthetase GluQRS [Caulobacteraceae bacterium]|nr:tRNA glutamyl-Q(34) synthetase GluQRS [Caulobacteraceae bacterium]